MSEFAGSALTLSSLDKFGVDDLNKWYTRIRSKFGLIMDITLKIDKEGDFIANMAFFKNSTKINIDALENDTMLDLIEKYRLDVNRLVEKNHSISKRTAWNTKVMFTAIKNVRSVTEDVKSLFHSLRRMNVFTTADSDEKVLARTTIELDADIVTLLKSELLSMNMKNTFLIHMHSHNVYLANRFFEERIDGFFLKIRTLSNLVRLVSVLTWLIPNLFSNYSTLLHYDGSTSPFIIIVQLVNLIGVPALLFKFTPKIMGYIIRHKILSNLVG